MWDQHESSGLCSSLENWAAFQTLFLAMLLKLYLAVPASLCLAAPWAPVKGLDAENSSGLIEKPAVPVGGRWPWQIPLEASVRDAGSTYSLCAFRTMSVIYSYVSVRVSLCYGAQKTDVVASSFNWFLRFSSVLQAKKSRWQWCGIILPHSSCCWLMCVLKIHHDGPHTKTLQTAP